jgi:glycosyltransferase involved in cell wall biosynthesis
MPISAVLITLNAERHLPKVLEALRGLDEIVILDSGSTDRTKEIAERYGVVWQVRPFDGYGPQKQAACALAKNDWILSVDADEVLDAEAQTALKTLVLDDPRKVWEICRRNYIGSREIRYGALGKDFPIRLFNRTVHRLNSNRIHESVEPQGPVLRLSGSMLHYTYSNLTEIFRPKFLLAKAVAAQKAQRRSSGPALALRAAWSFGKSYLLQRGFLDGPVGVGVALGAAVASTFGLVMASDPACLGESENKE